jgi:hypothetical protein
MTMLKRTCMIFLLPLLFLFAQHGAVTHEISHYSERAPLTQQKQQTPHSPICDKCVAYGEMANALNANSFVAPIISVGLISAEAKYSTYHYQITACYQARAPPTLL